MKKMTSLLFLFFQFHVSIRSSLLQPDFSVKIYNTENIILTFDNLNDNDDLEMIRVSEKPDLDKKLYNFHSYVKRMATSEKPVQETGVNEYFTPMTLENDRNEKYEKKMKNIGFKWLKKLRYKKKKKRKKFNKRDVGQNETVESVNELEKEYQDFLTKIKENDAAYRYTDEGSRY